MEIKCIGSGSKGNAYLVNDGHSTLLIECGVQFKKIQQACGFKTNKILACLITHEHKDHCLCVKEILKRGIQVVCTKGTAEALGIEHHPYVLTIKYGRLYGFNNLTVTAFETEHDAVEPCGFMIDDMSDYILTSDNKRIPKQRLVYITDSYYCRYKFEHMTDIMIECNYDDMSLISGDDNVSLRKRVLKSHMSLESCVELLKSNDLSKVDCVHLMHLSDRNSDEERMKRKVAEATGKRVVVF
jgi:phosphoribosyl 1,2-cyclic phosphodiesterase